MQAQQSPHELIKLKYHVDIHSDTDVVPDKNAKGDIISKNGKKAILKEFGAHKKKHDRWLANIEKDPEYLHKLQADIARAQAALGELPLQ